MGDQLETWIIISLFGAIVVLSIGFEEFQHWITHHFKATGQETYLKMIDACFKVRISTVVC